MKEYFSKEAVSILKGLTEKDENLRLGCTDINDIKKHAFFKGIDWEKLAKNQVPAPVLPKVKSATDFCLIDEEFLNDDEGLNKMHDDPETKVEREAGASGEIPNFQFINPKVL
jgi:hypothetical protein